MHVTPRSRACDQARSLASLRLDDELSELESALLEAHLGACAACSAFMADIESATVQLRRAPLARLDHGLVLPSIHRRGYLRGLQTAAASAVAVAAVVAGFIAVTPVITSPSENRSATRFSEPVSVRWELQLRRQAQPSEGTAGIDIPV